MRRIFPEASDYRTVTKTISSKQREIIESRLGFQLLPGQREQFQYFSMTGKYGKQIGTIIAASQKGEYGAIEFVFGLDTNLIIKGIYIQRSRERDQSFKKREFLDSFVGRNIKDVSSFNELYKGVKSTGTDAVIQGLDKECITYKEIVLSNNTAK
ncbi:MAG: hypothetical protein GXY77_14005 [Fibrobacter sp.]|nr:hypothetical protein [Fibrobacter sp.]